MRQIPYSACDVGFFLVYGGSGCVYGNMRIPDPKNGYRDCIVEIGEAVKFVDGVYRITDQGLEKMQ